LLWTLIPTTIALIVVQEMAARMGAVTGKGLHDLIREEFGIRATFFVSFVFGLADLGNIVAEFAGLASGMGLFGISKYIVVPIAHQSESLHWQQVQLLAFQHTPWS